MTDGDEANDDNYNHPRDKDVTITATATTTAGGTATYDPGDGNVARSAKMTRP